MRRLLAGTLAVIGIVCLPGLALSENAQQERMKSCNAEAGTKGLSGSARKAFMSECLAATRPAPQLNSQQQKMKDCNVKAGEQKLTGTARKAFMSSCLRG